MHETRRFGAFLSLVGIGIIAGSVFLTGCVSLPGESSLNDWVAPSADQVWTPPSVSQSQGPTPTKRIDIPEDLLKTGAKWRLIDIIGIALRNNPDTRSAWYAARSAAADWLSQKGNNYPQINGDVGLSHTDLSGSATRTSQSEVVSTIDAVQPAVQLSWLLFDFGGRRASIDEKRQALLAADFTHDAVIQTAVFQVIQAYFQYANAKAIEKAYRTSLHDAAVNLAAAQQRHDNGLATIADVLQAQTALSQAQLNLDNAVGQVQTIRGALATAMGIPANTPYDIEDLPLNPPVNRFTETVDACIKQAQIHRPDLSAQKNRVQQALAQIRVAHSAIYPSLTLGDAFGGNLDNHTAEWGNQNEIGIMVSIPIFDGYSSRYNELKAREDAENQKAQLESLEQTVIFEVWSSYFNLKTAAQQVKTSGDLLKSAQQSYDVALGRYKEGVGGFLDLISAESALASARAQRVTALADWYISLSQLARDTGILWRQKPGAKGDILHLFPTATIKDR